MNTLISIFKALSDRNRLRIFSVLMHYDELCACQIVELLEVAGATASRHLSQLVNAGLLESRKDGRWIYYRLSTDPFISEVGMQWLSSHLSDSEDYHNDLKELDRITTLDREVLCRKQRGETCCPVLG